PPDGWHSLMILVRSAANRLAHLPAGSPSAARRLNCDRSTAARSRSSATVLVGSTGICLAALSRCLTAESGVMVLFSMPLRTAGTTTIAVAHPVGTAGEEGAAALTAAVFAAAGWRAAAAPGQHECCGQR